VDQKVNPAGAASSSTSRLSGVFAVLLLGAVAASAAYAADAGFAAHVDSWASAAKARASMLVSEIAG
jgi:hypothetical protein